MGLADVQNILARLYTDGAFRERFFSDPDAVGTELHLDPEDARQLLEARDGITRFAQSLQVKRLGEAGRFLPVTRRLLGVRYGPLFLQYAATPPPGGPRKPQADAIRFARFLAAHPDPDLEPWLREVARFEAAWIEAESPSPLPLVGFFRWPIHRLVCGEAPDAVSPEHCLGLWLRSGRHMPLRHFWLQRPSRGA